MATSSKRNLASTFVTVVFVTGGLAALLFVILWVRSGFDAAWDKFYNFVSGILEE